MATNDTPPDLATALAKAGLAEFFAGCTASHRREYLKWIGEAKKPETRVARVEKTVAMIAERHAREEGLAGRGKGVGRRK
jgi:uncharacterized protein YdeI (YjbR/CyaY-like superfamily)